MEVLPCLPTKFSQVMESERALDVGLYVAMLVDLASEQHDP